MNSINLCSLDVSVNLYVRHGGALKPLKTNLLDMLALFPTLYYSHFMFEYFPQDVMTLSLSLFIWTLIIIQFPNGSPALPSQIYNDHLPASMAG